LARNPDENPDGAAVEDGIVSVDASAPIDVRLVEVKYAARDIHLFVFETPDGATLPKAEPGAHIDVHFPNGTMRQYSLIDTDRSDVRYTIGVKRDAAGTGGSVHLHDQVKVGQILKVSHPRNHFPLYEDAAHTVLVAGGIGITPISAMAERLEKRGRSWEMHYSSRSREDAAFLRELSAQQPVHLHFDAEANGAFLDLAAIVARAPSEAHFYCCGPLPMLKAFELATAGLPPEHVHVEYFTAKDAAATEGGFTVELRKSGTSFQIPAGKTILDVLRDAGLNLPASCEKGVCGTCETRVLVGTPDHRDAILTESEKRAGDTMMICCSGAKSDRLVLDL
jgi:ferredoxin-NADP reductase